MWNVQIPLQKKISICGLMAMGLVYEPNTPLWVTHMLIMSRCTACSAVRVKSLRAKAKDIVCEYMYAHITTVSVTNGTSS